MKNILTYLLWICSSAVFAQTDTIKLPGKQLHTEYLKPGMKQYQIVSTNPKAPKAVFMWYWLRDIKRDTRNGAPVFTITQRWYGADTANWRAYYSVNRASDFAAIYHKEVARGKTNAYNWTGKRIAGADTVATNSKKGFALDFAAPNLNWNLDIEVFEMLPLAAGKVFAINFYDAGLDPPAYITYKVTGSEVINYGGHPTDCWKLFTQNTYKNQVYTETYWISKAGHEFLREEDDYGQGMHRSKIKMPVNINL